VLVTSLKTTENTLHMIIIMMNLPCESLQTGSHCARSSAEQRLEKRWMRALGPVCVRCVQAATAQSASEHTASTKFN
jgi:hypothetical protein